MGEWKYEVRSEGVRRNGVAQKDAEEAKQKRDVGEELTHPLG